MRNTASVLKSALSYLVMAGAWIILGDYTINQLSLAPQHIQLLQWLKDLLFVLLSALVLFVILQRNTRQKRHARQELQEREKRLQLALDGSGDGLWDWDLRDSSTFFSASYAALLGETPEALGNDRQGWSQRLHPDDRQYAEDTVAALLADPHETHYSCIYRLRHKNGSYRWIHSRGSLIRSSNQTPERFIGIASDITQQRLDEDNLRLGYAMLDISQEGILVCDAYQRIIHVNPAFTRITGYSSAEALGNLPSMVKSGHHDRAFYQVLWRELQATGHWSGEVWNRRKNGEIYPQWHSICLIRDKQGRVSHYLAVFSDLSLLKRSQHELDYLAHYDPLTNLPNRLLLQQRIEHIQAQCNLTMPAAVLLIDLDHFKHINESLGHNVGDALLKAVGERFLKVIPSSATLARLGGDEFALLHEQCLLDSAPAEIADKLLRSLDDAFHIADHELYITASIGISLLPTDACNAEQALRNADSALFKAKNSGRENYAFYQQQLTDYAQRRVQLASGLRQALENQQLEVYYQPLHELSNGQCIGAEALVRWQHPERGLVAPNDFIPIAEDNGMIGAIDLWVLRNACQKMVEWSQAGHPPISVAVNVSSRLFSRGELDQTVAQVLAETGLDPAQLELEITESAIMDDPKAATALLARLRALGVRLAIDDFGTGYSSLARLRRLPVDKLKIDQSFVRGLPHDKEDAAIASTIIALGHSLGLKVLAEGIETDEQRQFLQKLGCDYGQGYLFGRPQPAQIAQAALRLEVC